MIVAARTAHAGDLREALRLFAELLADQERELGRDDEFTLQTRSAIGFATHQLGHAREALRLFAELLPDQERVLGHDHADTLETRGRSRSVPEMWATRGRRCGCSPSCCRTRSACWAMTTKTRSTHAATSRGCPPNWARRGRRCGCPPNC